MGQVPARLVYTDNTATEQVIGSFRPQDPTTGNISTFTIEENAKNYKRVIIEGGPTLQDSMPTSLSEFNGDEPEIRVEVDSNLDGTWEERLRVYPEIEGTTNDRGRYKNKDLWGFKKYYGEDDVDTGTVSTDLTDALQALLPTGYTARYPGDITAPNVSNYSFSGARQQGFRELQRYYNHYILFTTETDGSGNYYVDLQPKGYGGVQFSLNRGTDGYTYNYWKKADSSNVVSKVKVVGKDSNGGTVERIIAAGAPNGIHGSDTDNIPDDFVDPDPITAVDTVNGVFTISGDKRVRYPNGASIEVFGSTGNDNTYEIDNTDYDSVNDETEITVVDADKVVDGTADGSLVPKPARRKFRRIHVDYIITTAEADEIAKKVISPNAIEQGEIEHELNIESTLNQSVGIVDNNRTPANPIDDVFTVVKQKDFIHQGVTQYSFEFEKEATEEQVDKWTEHDFERASVYPEGQQDVGQQTLNNADTGGDTSNAERDPNDNGVLGNTSNAERDPNDDGVLGNTSNAERDPNDNGILAEEPINDGGSSDFNSTTYVDGWQQVCTTGTVNGDVLAHRVGFYLDISSVGDYAVDIAVVRDGSDVVYVNHVENVTREDVGDITGVGTSEDFEDRFVITPDGWVAGSSSSVSYELHVNFHWPTGDSAPNYSANLEVEAITHAHSDDVRVVDNTDHPHNDDVRVVDNTDHPHNDDVRVQDVTNHGDSSGGGGHDVTGSTDSKNVNVATEDKTDR